MNIASRFQTQPEEGPLVQITVDGTPVTAAANMTLAAALLAHSGEASRQTMSGAGRTAFCMMGVCFDCLVDVDGTPNTQACMTIVRDGMVVKRQSGLRGLGGGRGDV
ncbi:(2Fe-2S)-binding protein [Gymnodinialimonas sp. 57CJ19]|uniref:(2Fe-2S)-binding protein n=1 Tax=Gymnodinialimonas sp. 57CJ19 TaxID=3138498 RepID=UPI003134385E